MPSRPCTNSASASSRRRSASSSPHWRWRPRVAVPRRLPLPALRRHLRNRHQRGERVTAEPCLRHEVRGGTKLPLRLVPPLTLALSPQAGRGNPSQAGRGNPPASTPAAPGTMRPSSHARPCASANTSLAPRSSSNRTRPSWSSLAGASKFRHATIWSSAAPRRESVRSSARPPTPCCSKSSTTSSCRSPSRWAKRCAIPRSRSTSRSGSTSPVRSSTRRESSSQMPPTCRCTWAPWTNRWRPSSAPTRARCAPATSTC